MDNSEKYHFNDFTQSHYIEILKLAKQNYLFANYENFKEKEAFLIWRHDVDFSMEYAIELAKIENDLNIKSTYFLHIHSEFYNLLEYRSKKQIKQLINLGHDIGVHFDTHYYNIRSKDEIEKHLSYEKNLFIRFFEKVPVAFSFHNTNEFIISCQDEYYAELKNTYAKVFQSEIGYCSDSNGYWRFDRLYDVIKSKKYKKLQVLTHPEWWQEEVRSPKERVLNILEQRKAFTNTFYDNLMIEMGRENIK
jgi:hypothetical protein